MSEQSTIPAGERPSRGGSTGRLALAKLALAMLALLLLAAGLSFLAFKGSTHRPALPGGVQQVSPRSGYFGTLAVPSKPAPAIHLRNSLGQPVTLAQYRGEAVFVTFLYTHCPDVCPLISANLRVALAQLGPRAARTQVIAISVDPRGDTPASVASFLRAHELTGRMQYLIGSPTELSRAWAAWSVGSQREVGQPDLVAHSALIYGISASGKLTTLYPDTFEPSEIVHDQARLLAH